MQTLDGCVLQFGEELRDVVGQVVGLAQCIELEDDQHQVISVNPIIVLSEELVAQVVELNCLVTTGRLTLHVELEQKAEVVQFQCFQATVFQIEDKRFVQFFKVIIIYDRGGCQCPA